MRVTHGKDPINALDAYEIVAGYDSGKMNSVRIIYCSKTSNTPPQKK